MKINKNNIVDIIYKRLNGIVSKKNISSVLNIICKSMINYFIDGKSIKIEHFGIFEPYIFHGHKGWNVELKKMQYVAPKKSIRLRIDPYFRKKTREQMLK